MPRIRTIKPEFPQSESVGRLSRDARLLFIQLWTLADDEGRARGSSRMLASLLYPYDDDAPSLMQAWLDELERSGCIRQYEHEGSRYLEICNWLKHQKIDKPSRSRLPEITAASRIVAKVREASETDLGPRTSTKDQSEAIASDADAPARDIRKDLFGKGRETLERITGKTPDSCRSLIGKWLKAVDDEAIHVLGAIEDAERNRVADPVAWINKTLNPRMKTDGQGRPRALQDDALSVSRALERQQREGGIIFGPRPRLLPDDSEGNLRLLPPGRSA